MKSSRWMTFATLSLPVLLVAGVLLINLRAEENKAPSSTTETATPAPETAKAAEPESGKSSLPASKIVTAPTNAQFAVPDGANARKLDFLDRLTRPSANFTSAAQADKYWSQAAASLVVGADEVLAAKPTDAEASEAVQFKVEGLRILAMLGDKKADKERAEFLNACLKDPRFEVSSVVGPMRMVPKMRMWGDLDPTERTAAADKYIEDVKTAGPTPSQARLVVGFADSLADSPDPLDTELAIRVVDQLLPTFQKAFRSSSDPMLKELLAGIEGLGRRLHLLGNKIELEGTYLDGKPFDWKSYRGKVVLVDFWASTCPECLREIPNIQAMYREYHDKGFEVLGICMDNDRRLAEQYIRQFGMNWPQLFTDNPPEGWKHAMQQRYAVTSIPRAILVDQEGTVVTTLARGEILEAYLQKLLGPATGAVDSGNKNAAVPQVPSTTSR